jgi:endonuclease YncB( thermonuclease family)
MRHTRLAILVFLLGCQPQQAETLVDTSKPVPKPTTAKPATPEADVITGRVVRVIDGDTLEVLVNQEQVRIRLEGIDCPERNQPFGTKAKQALSGNHHGLDGFAYRGCRKTR